MAKAIFLIRGIDIFLKRVNIKAMRKRKDNTHSFEGTKIIISKILDGSILRLRKKLKNNWQKQEKRLSSKVYA